jgi:tRNA A37 threonylcarbamoyladenosine dehydratase
MEEFSRIAPLSPRWEERRGLKIVILGVGGVGGFALDCLYRSGFRNLTIVDGDRFDPSNRNRQIGSHRVGELKVKVLEELYPGVVGVPVQLKPGDILKNPLLEGAELIIDAIDQVPVKEEILFWYWFKVISSMGAGRRLDPTKVEVAPFSKTHTDPLARKLRSRLRKRGWEGDFWAVFSSEPPQPGEGSFVGVTGTFGFTLCSLVVQDRWRLG